MVIVGDEAIGSLKVTVTVIGSPGFMVLSGSLVVMLTVGVEVSTLKVILCVPATYWLPIRSVPLTVAE